ncbi:RING-H2 finger protein ATL1-like [Primulina huaijiensis]|uniref:RING-H2 finger protein ATL1-like n=1 Tax=Primulina huaijiensis TaxID=1492673 RepID=UPI003CC7425E
MGDHPPSPHLMPPPSSLSKSNMPILYYGLVVVGTAAVVLALYNLVVLKWCTDFSTNRYSRDRQRAMIIGQGSSRRYQNLNLDSVFSFKYKNEVAGQDIRNESECAVCLSVFEEGEELRQLPICKHSFHAPCIDMWLYSHMNCPICRCPVEPPPVLQRSAAMGQLEQSPSMMVPADIQRLAATELPFHPPHGLQGRGMLV